MRVNEQDANMLAEHGLVGWKIRYQRKHGDEPSHEYERAVMKCLDDYRRWLTAHIVFLIAGGVALLGLLVSAFTDAIGTPRVWGMVVLGAFLFVYGNATAYAEKKARQQQEGPLAHEQGQQ